jgi:hypothetical protein
MRSTALETYLSAVENGAVSIYYDNALKLATTATGIDVTGTVVSDGLTVDGTPTNYGYSATLNSSSNANMYFGHQSSVANNRMYISHNWYRDGSGYHADDVSSGIGAIGFDNGKVFIGTDAAGSSVTKQRLVAENNGDISFYEDTGTTPKFFWDASAEALGIGTSSPQEIFHVNSGTGNVPALFESTDSISVITFKDGGSSNLIASGANGNNHVFYNGTERMRIDSSGNLLVGKTSSALSSVGQQLQADGRTMLTRDGNQVLDINRLTSDGDIVRFYKDGSTVGSILQTSDELIFNSIGDGGLAKGGTKYFRWSNSSFYPHVDNAYDLGFSFLRYDDIYATNGTIQTSDRNEKQDIEELTDAEQRVAVAAKGLLRKYRWKDAVAEKGDEARIHFGIIAQDLQAAFEAEGLDAGRYGMFISSTWTDEETGEERTRMGVRYPQLLAFIIAAL